MRGLCTMKKTEKCKEKINIFVRLFMFLGSRGLLFYKLFISLLNINDTAITPYLSTTIVVYLLSYLSLSLPCNAYIIYIILYIINIIYISYIYIY